MEHALCEAYKRLVIHDDDYQATHNDRRTTQNKQAGSDNCFQYSEHVQGMKKQTTDSQLMIHSLVAQQEKDNDKIRSLEADKESIKLKYKQLSWEYDRLRERSNEITSQMANKLEAKGELENLGDVYANTKLANIFQDVYDNKWTALLEWFHDDVKMNEYVAISHLSNLLKECYTKCVRCAEEQLRTFLFMENDDDVIPTDSEDPALYQIRRLYGQKEKTRKHVTQRVVKELQKSQYMNPLLIGETSTQSEAKLEEFFKEYTDCCWLLTISHPPLVLNFDVIGKPYSGKLIDLYGKYSTQDKFADKDREVGTIVAVVWPSLATKDDATVYKKGDVITVDVKECDLTVIL